MFIKTTQLKEFILATMALLFRFSMSHFNYILILSKFSKQIKKAFS